jgi:hypothetical protein
MASSTPTTTMQWENVDKNKNTVPRLKLEEGTKYRIKLMVEEPTFALMHYIQGAGYVRSFAEYEMRKGTVHITKDGLDMTLLGKDPTLYYSIPVLVYEVDKKGAPVKNGELEFKLWSFTSQTGSALAAIHAEWGDLTKVDLTFTGKKQGKGVTPDNISAAKDCLALKNPTAKAVTEEWELFKFKEVDRFMGRTLTEEEFIKAVGAMPTEDQTDANPKNQIKK